MNFRIQVHTLSGDVYTDKELVPEESIEQVAHGAKESAKGSAAVELEDGSWVIIPSAQIAVIRLVPEESTA